jgi:hypothetical protein
LLQLLTIGLEVSDRSARNTRIHRSFRNRWRDVHDETRIERLRYQILRPEMQIFDSIGACHHIAVAESCERRNCVDGCNFHLASDGRCTCIECAAKDEWKAQNVVDLIGIVRAAGRDHRIAPNCFHLVGQNFGRGVGKRENQRTRGHFFRHVLLEHAARRETEENIGAFDHIAQGASVRRLRKPFLLRIHELSATSVDDTRQIREPDVLFAYADFD